MGVAVDAAVGVACAEVASVDDFYAHCVAIAGGGKQGAWRHLITVGAVEHPMLPEHYIEWIALETAQGNQRKPLAPGQKPEAVFMLAEGDSVVAAYEYCNLHGLWVAEI